MIQITRFPFIFWALKEEPDARIDGNHIIKNDKRYEIKKSPIWVFLLAKYLFVVIGLIFVFSKFDFVASLDKFLQYSIALILVFFILVLPKKFMIGFVVFLALLIILAIVFGKVYFISFILKYCIVFFVFFTALLDSRKVHYYVLNDNKKIVANIITEDF